MAPTTAALTDLNINYDVEKAWMRRFIESFVGDVVDDLARMDLDEDYAMGVRRPLKYYDQLQRIADRQQNSIVIDLDDISNFEQEGYDRVQNAMRNAKRYRDLFADVIDGLMPQSRVEITENDDVLDVIMHQRKQRDDLRALQERQATGGAGVVEAGKNFPPLLTRRFSVYLKASETIKPIAIRGIRARDIGHLVQVRGIVTRISDVKPLLVVQAYSCDMCGCEVFQEVNSKQYMPLVECPSEECRNNDAKGKLYSQTRASKFLRFQEVKIQEQTDQVPMGHIPRTMTVHLYDELTRMCNPGDVVILTGIFLPTPYTGFKAIRAGLIADTYLEAQHVVQVKERYTDMRPTAEIMAQIDQAASTPGVYDRLAKSIAPEIYGHEDVKKALLLQLVGGVEKRVQDGMQIRGDMHICLMGDPGVAKSQLLKFICKIAPRGVYTTGRGSSGVGLTAAVMHDPLTDEMVLEGGALVLADHGICCIDEFDKMDDADRAAIHEVMEQQTCSIAKAGITTTLNARTSILSAANPAFGRYNIRRTPMENINLPAALLSRFDIIFLLLDKPDRDQDTRLARHVAWVHQHGAAPELDFDPFEPDMLRQYVARARQFRPVVPPHVGDYLVGAYVQLRQQEENERRGSFTQRNHTQIGFASPRTLLGITRLAQAHARIRFSNTVDTSDVDEALRLMDAAKSSLLDDSDGTRRRQERLSPSDAIYQIVRGMVFEASDGMDIEEGGEVNYSDVLQRIQGRGYTEQDLERCVKEYEDMNVWQLNRAGTKIRFV